MTLGVGRGGANDVGGGDGAFEGALKRLIEEMMASEDACSRAGGSAALREYPEPQPGIWGARGYLSATASGTCTQLRCSRAIVASTAYAARLRTQG